MGNLNRLLKKLLLWINVIVLLIIICSVAIYARIMIAREIRSKIELEELSRVKDRFIAVASHELKTPVTTIKASMQVVEKITQQKDISEIRSFIANTNMQIARLTNIINDLLDVSRIRSEQLRIHKEYCFINDILKDTLLEIESIKKDREIIVKGNTSFQLYVDKIRIKQVLVNLLSNALKYSPQEDKITVNLEKSEKYLRVSVHDFGVGIPKNKQKQIFEPFFRVHEKSDKYSGLGMGLYISAEIIKRHGGKIGVVSEQGKGSVFWFKIPTEERGW